MTGSHARHRLVRPGCCPQFAQPQYVDQELVLQLEVLGPTEPDPVEQVQLQLDCAKAALSDPVAVLQLDWLQLEVL